LLKLGLFSASKWIEASLISHRSSRQLKELKSHLQFKLNVRTPHEKTPHFLLVDSSKPEYTIWKRDVLLLGEHS